MIRRDVLALAASALGSAILPPGEARAHLPPGARGPNGGEVQVIGPFHGELVATDGELVLFLHSILGGATLDAEELLATVKDVALIADEYDDRIVKKYGGQTMRDLLEEAAVERILDHDPKAFRFGTSEN